MRFLVDEDFEYTANNMSGGRMPNQFKLDHDECLDLPKPIFSRDVGGYSNIVKKYYHTDRFQGFIEMLDSNNAYSNSKYTSPEYKARLSKNPFQHTYNPNYFRKYLEGTFTSDMDLPTTTATFPAT